MRRSTFWVAGLGAMGLGAMSLGAMSLGAMGLVGCVPTDFEDLRGEAQVVALEPAGDYPNAGFGEVVVGYGGTLGGLRSSRVAITAGSATPFTVFPVLTDERLRLDSPVLDGCEADGSPCMAGAGAALVGLPRWGSREMCVATAATASGEIRMACEDDPTRLEVVSGPSGQRFGISAAGIPVDHPFGRAVFGAPDASSGRGAVYRLPDGAAPVEIDLSGGFGGAGGEIGSAVAVAVLDADTVLVAAGAPVGANKRVIVATSDVGPGGAVTTSVHGCLDATTEGWGEALAIGDLDGDGLPEVVVGSGVPATGTSDRADVVRVYSGAAMPDPGACDDSWPVAVELTCPSTDDVVCGDGAFFGVSLAIGDVDGDGVLDLLAGAPGAQVGEVGGAGAVFVFRGSSSGLTDLSDEVVALRLSRPGPGDRLGSALSVAPGLDDGAGVARVEPVVGAPGASRVYVFLCSELEGDQPTEPRDMRCQPRQP